MKLITLNTWGGRVTEPLSDFFKKYSKDTDVFCLQEVFKEGKNPIRNTLGVTDGWRAKLFFEISDALPNFEGYFRPFVFGFFGLASFVSSVLNIDEEGDIFVYKDREHVPSIDDPVNHGRNIQYLKLKMGNSNLTIINFHGLWNGKGKTDTEDRLNQSRRIVEFAATVKGPLILCGDFNLLPDTESLKILEGIGLRNLIKEYGVTTTRTPLYTRASASGHYADYILVSPDIKVNDFRVLPDVVSDHAPLFLDFNII